MRVEKLVLFSSFGATQEPAESWNDVIAENDALEEEKQREVGKTEFDDCDEEVNVPVDLQQQHG